MALLQPRQNLEEGEYVPPVATSDIASAAYELAWENDTEVGALARMDVAEDLAARGKMKTTEELNEMFPNHRFDKPMTDLAAQFKVDQEERRAHLEGLINDGNNGFFKGSVVPFAVTMGTVMADPIGATAGFVTSGMGKLAVAGKAVKTLNFTRAGKLASGAGKAIKAGKFSKAFDLTESSLKALNKTSKSFKAMSSISSRGAQYGLDLAENILGNSASELLVAAGREAQYEKYTADEFLANAIGSSLIFTTAIHGFGKTIDRLGGRTVDNAMSMAEANIEVGKDPFDTMNSFLKFAENDSKVDPTFSSVFKSSFPGLELDEAGGLHKAFKDVQTAFSKGEIAEADMDDFLRKLNDSDFDNAKLGYAEDNPTPNVDDEFLDNANTRMSSEESDFGYDAKAAEIYKDAEGYTAIEVEDAKLDADIQMVFKELDEETAKTINTKFEALDREAVRVENTNKAMEQCLLGVADGEL